MNSDIPSEPDDDDFTFDPNPIPEINTFDDWLNFIYEPASVRPEVPSLEAFKGMTKKQQKASCVTRMTHIARFQPIITPSRFNILEILLQRVTVNRIGGRGARGSAVLTGYPYIGKTTLAKDIGKRVDLDIRKALKSRSGQDQFVPETEARFIPVMYVSLSSEDTSNIKALYSTFARFLGIPKYDKMTTKRLEDAIAAKVKECRTSFIIINEIHYIDVRTRGVMKTNTAIKTLMNRIPATFLFAGTDCENTGIFFDHNPDQKKKLNPKFAQLNHRCLKLELLPFQNRFNNYDEGLKFIKAMDEEIVLLNHQKGALIKLAPYILKRTNGYVGSIRDLINIGSYKAIKKEKEQLTEEWLDIVQLDNAAETQKGDDDNNDPPSNSKDP